VGIAVGSEKYQEENAIDKRQQHHQQQHNNNNNNNKYKLTELSPTKSQTL